MPEKQNHQEDDTLVDLLAVQLRGMYDVEMQIIKTIPKIIKMATNERLGGACDRYRLAAGDRLKQLEEVFVKMEIKPAKLPSAAVRGLAEDMDWIGKNMVGCTIVDAGLAASVRLLQRYEITLYVEAASWAERLDLREVAGVLEEAAHEMAEDIRSFEESVARVLDDNAVPDGLDGAEEDEGLGDNEAIEDDEEPEDD